MTVIIKLDTGESCHLDRNLSTLSVAQEINDGRGKGKLISFQNNSTPSRIIYIDPDHVVAIENDGYPY